MTEHGERQDGTGIDFADLGWRLGMPPLAAVCCAIFHGYPLLDDRLPSNLVAPLAERCGIRLVDPRESEVGILTASTYRSPADDPQPRRRLLRMVLQRMINRKLWLPAVGDNHAIVRGLPTNEKGVARDAMAALQRAGWLRAPKASADPALGLVAEERSAIEAAADRGEIDHPVVLDWLEG